MAAVKLSICAIASEVVPLAKTGGLADVASALSRQLSARGHDVRLFVPFYRQISRQDLAKMVGASREMVSRVMKDLEERGFVQTQDDGSMIVKERLLSLA